MILKRYLSRIYHQQGAKINQLDKKIDFIFGENNNFSQIGHANLRFERTLEKNGSQFEDDTTDIIRLLINEFAHLFKKATILTTGGSEIEQNKPNAPVFSIKRVSTNIEGGLSSYFDKRKEDKIKDTTLGELLIDNHTIQNTKEKIFGQLSLEHNFGLCNTFKKVTKNLDSIKLSKQMICRILLTLLYKML